MSLATEAQDTRLADRIVRDCSRGPVSLDEPLGDVPDPAEVAEERGAPSPRSAVIAHERRAQVRLASSRLDTRSRRALEVRQGPTGAGPGTLDHIRAPVTLDREEPGSGLHDLLA